MNHALVEIKLPVFASTFIKCRGLAVVAFIVGCNVLGCGSLSAVPAEAKFGQNRDLLLRLFDFWDTPAEKDLGLVAEIAQEAAELASSNGTDGRVVPLR